MSTNKQVGAFEGKSTTVMFAAVILGALITLALLRHFFGNIRVEAGSR